MKKDLHFIDWENYNGIKYFYFKDGKGEEDYRVDSNTFRKPRTKEYLDAWRYDGRSLLHRFYTNLEDYKFLIEEMKLNPFIKNFARETPYEYLSGLEVDGEKPDSQLYNDILEYLKQSENRALSRWKNLYYVAPLDNGTGGITVKADKEIIHKLKKGEKLDDYLDKEGNTILHRKYVDEDSWRVLLDLYRVNPFIKNKEGLTIKEWVLAGKTYVRKGTRKYKRLIDIIEKAEKEYK